MPKVKIEIISGFIWIKVKEQAETKMTEIVQDYGYPSIISNQYVYDSGKEVHQWFITYIES